MSNLPDFVAEFSKDVPEVLKQTIKDCASARENVYGGESDASLHEIHEHLVRNRSQIERMEYLVSNLVLLKSRTAQIIAQRKAAVEDKYRAVATKPSAGFADFATAKEKDAHYQTYTVEETLALRKAEILGRDVEASWDFCRILLRGAEGVQRDLETRLRLITLTSQLER